MASGSAKSAAPIKKNMTVGQAFECIINHNMKYMQEWIPVAYAGKNIRGVHQARVALRRARSAITLFRPAIPRALSQDMAMEMKWAASEMGPARDTDVFISEILGPMSGKIDPKAGERKLAAMADKHRDKAYAQVRAMVDSKRFKTLKSSAKAFAGGKFKGKTPAGVKKALDGNIVDFAQQVMDKRLNKIMAMGKRMKSMSEVELHELRIECKKMRYACEFFTPLFGKAQMSKFVTALKGLQGILGTLQDAAVMPNLLAGITKGAGDKQVKQYCNNLIEWRASSQKKAFRAELFKQWKTFSGVKRPWN